VIQIRQLPTPDVSEVGKFPFHAKLMRTLPYTKIGNEGKIILTKLYHVPDLCLVRYLFSPHNNSESRSCYPHYAGENTVSQQKGNLLRITQLGKGKMCLQLPLPCLSPEFYPLYTYASWNWFAKLSSEPTEKSRGLKLQIVLTESRNLKQETAN
jgi:hypothetical protein